MTKKRKWIALLLLLISCLAYWKVDVDKVDAEVIDKIIAAVNGEPIAMSSLKKRLLWLESSKESSEEFSENVSKDVPKDKEELIKYALEGMIDDKLQLQEARRLGIIVMDDELQLGVAQKRMQFPTLLRKIGITEEELKEEVRDEVMIRKMVDRKFRLFLEISDPEAATYYEQNKEKFFEPEKVKLQQVLVGIGSEATAKEKAEAKLKANEIWLKLREKGKLEELREIYKGDNVVIKVESDYIEAFSLLPAISNAIAKLQVGEISPVVETPIGYSILKLEARQPRRPKPFSEVMEAIKVELLAEMVKADLQSWLKDEREKADIRIIDEGLSGNLLKK
jgi:parvulin-like peptidyl-prolyl isomerase